MGFGSGAVRSTPLECGLCRGLVYCASRLVPCQCCYCRDCVGSVGQDCLRCGRDVEGSELDPKLDGQVEMFLQAHVGGGEDRERARGLMMLQHAMRHRMGGNRVAAEGRLVDAITALDASREEKAVAMATLAEVRGESEAGRESAASLFDQAIVVLREGESMPFTVSITRLKQGLFLWEKVGNLEEALRCFRFGVDARKQALAQGQCTLEDLAFAWLYVSRVASVLQLSSVIAEATEAGLSLLSEHAEKLGLSDKGTAMQEEFAALREGSRPALL